MSEYQSVSLDREDAYLCLQCGTVVVDQTLHNEWHQRKGDPVDLSGLGGANDPGPMPPKGGEAA